MEQESEGEGENFRVQPPDGLAFFPLLRLGEGRDEGWSNATLLPDLSAVVQRSGTKEEPFEGDVFDDGFVEAHAWFMGGR